MISKSVQYPSKVGKVPYGSALFATKDIPVGTIVQQFIGKVVDYDECTDIQKSYVLNTPKPGSDSEWIWLLTETDSRNFLITI
jgi:hypothetical protein